MNGVLVETVSAPNIVKGIVSRLGDGYVNISVHISSSTSGYTTMTVKYFDSLNGAASINQTINGPRGEYRKIYVTHDSVIDNLYAPFVTGNYIDSQKNIVPFFTSFSGSAVTYSATNDKLYALVCQTDPHQNRDVIFESPRQYSASVPQWTPATGLYAYIKAKS